MKDVVSVPTSHTVRPEGILVPVEVLAQVFAQEVETVCANLIHPLPARAEAPGLMVITNSKGADELIGFLKSLASERSLEVARLLDSARARQTGRHIQ